MAASQLLREIVQLHRRQLFGLIELRGVRRMQGLYDDSRIDLERKLSALRRAGLGEPFRAHHLRAVLAQVADAARGCEGDLAAHLQRTGKMATVLAPRQVIQTVSRMEEHFGRPTPVVQAHQAAIVAGVDRRVAPSLLSKYRTSVRSYGRDTVLSIQGQLARSIVQGETVDEAVDRVAGSSGLFEKQRWRAERIVRTEMSYSFGAAAQVAMEAISVPKLMKRLVATHDNRTGADSEELDGQTVPIDQPFVWKVRNSAGALTGKVVRYMQPPNRPNDRECVIPWMHGWAVPAGLGAPVEPTTRGLPGS